MLRGSEPVAALATTLPVTVSTATTRPAPFRVTNRRAPSADSTRCRGAFPIPRNHDTANDPRSTLAMSYEPITATYATRDDRSTAIPRGYAPSGTRCTSRSVWKSMTLMSELHQLVTRTTRSYTLTVCRYIMFCANTSPVPDGVTDFGEIAPLIVRTSVSVNDRRGSCAIVVVVVVGRTVVLVGGGAVTTVVGTAARTGTCS